MTTDTSERGLERLICTALTGHPCDPPQESGAGFGGPPAAYGGGAGWSGGNPHDYDREFCVDRVQLAAFLTSRPSRTPPNRWRWTRTVRRGASSWRGCRAKSRSAAPSTCCATASDTARTTWTCSTARRRPGTCRRRSASSRTASPSSGSFAIAATTLNGRWTSASSSTACRSSRSS